MSKQTSHLCAEKLCPTPEGTCPPTLPSLTCVPGAGKNRRECWEPVHLPAPLHHPSSRPPSTHLSPIFLSCIPPSTIIHHPSSLNLLSIFPPSIHHASIHCPCSLNLLSILLPSLHPPSSFPSSIHHPSSIFPPSVVHLPSTHPSPHLPLLHPSSIFLQSAVHLPSIPPSIIHPSIIHFPSIPLSIHLAIHPCVPLFLLPPFPSRADFSNTNILTPAPPPILTATAFLLTMVTLTGTTVRPTPSGCLLRALRPTRSVTPIPR